MGRAAPGSLLLRGLLGLLLAWGCAAQAPVFSADWGFASYEVIIPRPLVTRGGDPALASRVSYLLRIGGRRNIVHLHPKKLLLPRHLRVFSFTEGGARVEDQPYVPGNCNFRGSVEGSPRSEAALSTCLGGLRGMLRLEDALYQIEPLQGSYSFEHVVYRLEDALSANFTCGVSEAEIERRLGGLGGRAGAWTSSYIHQKYMEVMVVLDKLRYDFLSSNLTRAISDTLVMAGIMDTYFQVLNARIQLKAIEVWTDASKVNTSVKKLIQVLEQFSEYRRKVLYRTVRTDWTHLYVHKFYPDALGWAYVGSVCDQGYGASVSTLPDKNLVAPSTWSTHELGHGVGMAHDSKGCFCQGKSQCIMGAGGRFGFSNCSFVDYFNLVSVKGDCLDDIPGYQYSVKRCGNKVVDAGEECDCGTTEECKKDLCCRPDCRLRPGADCNAGLCCRDCRFKPPGHVCRGKHNACDLTEFCNGTSPLCPDDFYKQDGTPCGKEARCYRKGCNDRFLQCKRMFGSSARDAPVICYEEVHRRSDRFGNCGLVGRGYKRCRAKDMLCGRLQCVNVKSVPEMPDHTTVVFTHLKEFNIRCWGTDYHSSMRAMELRDDGAVTDGTACGRNLVCINRTCHNVSVLQYDCHPDKCNKRGVCNNRKDCHCHYGWAPPFCETPGYGGSIDSGPAGKMKTVSKTAKVVPIMFIRLVLLVTSLVGVILKGMIAKFLKQRAKGIVHLAKKPLAKKKRENVKKISEKKPRLPKGNYS